MYRMRSRLLPLLVVAAVGLAVVPSVAAGAATTGGGCGKSAAPSLTTQHLAVDGTDREYLLSIPPSYDASKRAPLLFDFHGLGSDMQQQALYSGLNQKAGAEGYVVITPNGTGTSLRGWSFPPLPGSGADVSFVKAMLATTQRTLCIDHRASSRPASRTVRSSPPCSRARSRTTRGHRARVGRQRHRRVPCGHAPDGSARVPRHRRSDCAVQRGRVLLGVDARRAGGLQAEAVDDAVANWARFDGCGTPASTTSVAGDVEHVTYPHCPSSGTVELYRVIGGGHTWPGAIPLRASVRRPRRSTPAR